MKTNSVSILVVCLFFMVNFHQINGQNIEGVYQDLSNQIEKKEWLKISGGLSAASTFNYIHGLDRRFDPFGWRINANLNLNLFGINAPFFASFSDGNQLYKLPSYAFYGISPNYKWATVHLGDRSMNFSPYTFSGHNFFGTGLELKPGKFRFSTFYGRLKRAVGEDLDLRQNLDPSFQRMGWGIKAGFESGNNQLAVILFQAKDNPGSLSNWADSLTIKPKENVVLGIIGKKQLGKVINLSIDYARSALTRDVTSDHLNPKPSVLLANMGGLFEPKNTSNYFNAIKTSIGFKLKFGNLKLNHEWIDPGYQTLGALFFNNDLENFTASGNTSILKNKVQFSGSFGIQRNNLSGDDNNVTRRLIGSINSSIRVNDQWNINLSYSNFSTTNRLRAVTVPFVQIDSIFLAQTNQSANLNFMYSIGKEKKSVFSALLAYQQANSIQNDQVQLDQVTTYYLGSLSHNYSIPSSRFNINSAVMVNYGIIPSINLLTISPSLSAGKSYFEQKLRLNTTLAYSTIWTNGTKSNQILSVRANVSYQIWKKHRINLDLSFVNNKTENLPMMISSFYETMGRLRYNFSF